MAGALGEQGPASHLPRRACGRHVAQSQLRRGSCFGAQDRRIAARPRSFRSPPRGDPFGQLGRPCPARARRDACRHPRVADLPGLFADVERPRETAGHLRTPETGPGVRPGRREIRAGARRHWSDRDAARRTPPREARRRHRRRVWHDRPGHRRQDPVHIRLHRHAQGRDQHPPHALLQPAKLGAALAIRRGDAAGAVRMAAVEPHFRR